MTDAVVTDLTRGVYRRIYGGFITGQRINKLTLNAEAWFWRVLATVDDFGNAGADPELVWLATKGKRKEVAIQDVAKWLREMKEVGLIETYKAKGEHYLHVRGFEDGQPAGRNGKRVMRVPCPGESGCIQNDPDKSRINVRSHSDPHSHSDSHTEAEAQTDDHKQRAKRTPEQRGTRLPDDFCLNSEMREWATGEAPHVDLNAAMEAFHDYWKGVPGSKGRKLDWLGTWRNRMRDLESRASSNGRGVSKVGKSMDAVKSVLAEIEHGQ